MIIRDYDEFYPELYRAWASNDEQCLVFGPDKWARILLYASPDDRNVLEAMERDGRIIISPPP